MNNLNWVKSSYSGGQSANCVEIAALPDGRRAVRDSKSPDGAILLLSPAQWRELARSVLAIPPQVRPRRSVQRGRCRPESRRRAPVSIVSGSRHLPLSAGEGTACRVGTGHG